MRLVVPAVEVADDRDGVGVGRPHAEGEAPVDGDGTHAGVGRAHAATSRSRGRDQRHRMPWAPGSRPADRAGTAARRRWGRLRGCPTAPVRPVAPRAPAGSWPTSGPWSSCGRGGWRPG
ncbi:hypothetical protein [Ornithinimicrobium kibberense]|uniref:hypothetical protein n=1 Tax=Ornithinimicrobium kibberense TaxID=282060 RepID=UPI00361CE5BD